MKNTFFLYDEDQNLWFLHFGLNSFLYSHYICKKTDIFYLVSLYFSFEAKNPNSDLIIDAYGWFVNDKKNISVLRRYFRKLDPYLRRPSLATVFL
jgi:hypothetical protein